MFPEDAMMDSEALAMYLQKRGVNENTINVLLREKATGTTLPFFSEQDLKEIGVNEMGQRKLIAFLVREHTNVFIMVDTPNADTLNMSVPIRETCLSVDPGPSTSKSSSTRESAQTKLLELDETDTDSLSETNTAVEKPGINRNINSKTIDIEKWIEKHSEQHEDLAKILQSNKFTNKHRRNLVKIVVSEMCSEWGNTYPSKEYKSRVAKAIVSTFPRLSSKIEGRSHESFYDEVVGEGYLEWRLKTIRKHLPRKEKRRGLTTEKPNKKKIRKQPFIDRPQLTESVLIEKISEMKHTKPTDSVKAQIERLLYETRPNRYTEIKSSESITVSDVLKKYPRLKNYEGEMIDNEFRDIFEGHDVLLARFPTHFAPRIIAHCKNVAPHLLEKLTDFDINLKAIVVLPELLPPPNHSNVTKAQNKAKRKQSGGQVARINSVPHPSLLQFIGANEDINSKISERSSLHKQPFLLCCTNMDQRKGPFFIQIENHLFPVGNNPLRAFDRLFKLHYMFDVHYAAALLNFYNFFESIVYNGLNTPKSCCDSLNCILSAVEIQSESAQTMSDSDSELESMN
ncbi:uncharacterized protein LOC143899736 isoform X3 [Temnothorax americanus]|uniref:uncharacterized protein LOC143899736 isoform X3 n=1 Tax=Temnothorax americanus TaxID=1964332 RepID=UPI0040694FE0